ncbi:MAG: hypothetical protein B7Z63_02835 [Ignavibacteriae bacterium 37-53-5]|nr:MAG: hypothetical protein B7Z63_02835 [Ignavibacteriae bacterium 37-53-5]
MSVKLGRQVYAAGDDMLPVVGYENTASSTIYVARRESKVDTITAGCKILLSTSFYERGKTYFVQVAECGEKNE